MRRLPLRIASPLGWAAVGGMGVAAALAAMTYFARADSIGPDLSGLQALIASVQATASTAQTQATAAQSSAASSAQAASTAATAAQTAQNAVQAAPGDYAGSFTRAAGLPAASSLNGKRIFVPDLGGGAGQLRSINGCWVRDGYPLNQQIQSIPVASTISLDGLANSPNILFTGSSMATKATIVMANACSMPSFVMSYPSGVFSATGALAIAGVATNANAVNVGGVGVTSSFGVFALLPDGSNYQRIMGPTLP